MRPAHSILPVLSLFALTAAGPLSAQEIWSSLEITVRAAEDDRPLAGAHVVIEGLGMRGVTNQSGFVRIPQLPVGERRVRVRYLGYAPMDETFTFRRGEPTRILTRMSVQPIALQEVRVRARRSLLVDRGFYDRQRVGMGTFYTRAQITAINPRFMSDVLRQTAGVRVGSAVAGRAPASIRGAGGARNCPIQYFIDGAMTYAFNIDDVQPGDVEGVEIYRGAASIPPEYNKGSALCGVILIWTRID